MRAAVITVSTSVARRQAEDESGPLLAALAEQAGAQVSAMEVLPDDYALLEDRLHHYVDDDFDLVLTTGGTGLSPDDVTPEATRAVIDRDAPGLAEALRELGRSHTPLAVLSRGVAGIAGRTLIVNLPGSPRAVREMFPAIGPALPHAVEVLRGSSRAAHSDHGHGQRPVHGPDAGAAGGPSSGTHRATDAGDGPGRGDRGSARPDPPSGAGA